ncbi:MAG: hypothetical protein LCH84_12730 [Gemmatimonadetes bacterium]|nr:hypothetical protein [Gemmatimonadota bacterium]
MTQRPICVTSWIGGYPFRDVPHPEPAVLARVLEREGFAGAWVGHLPGTFHRDPVPSNRALLAALAPHRDLLHPAPLVRPDWPGWERQLGMALDAGCPAVRACPPQWGLGASGPMTELTLACGEAGVALHLTVRFEDLRQRHPLDGAGDVAPALVRQLARIPGSRAQLVVAGASREFIEEVHWGLTVDEAARVWFDWHWLWGPPEDHFAHLVRTVGAARLAWSTWWPLRLTQQARALVDLLPPGTPATDFAFADGRSIAAAARASAGRASTP